MRYELFLLLLLMCCYAMATVHWYHKADLPLARTGYAAGEFNGKLLIAGGSYWVNDKKLRTARTDCFDPQSNSWEECTPLPLALSDVTSVTIDGRIYAIGGTEGEATRRSIYRFTNGRWEEWRQQLPEPRMNLASATDGRFLYVIGGLSVLNRYDSATATVWRMDTAALDATWERLPDLPGPGRFTHTATWAQGRLYVFGGCTASGDTVKNFADVHSFDPEVRAWKREPDMPSARRALFAASDGTDILLLGGFANGVLDEVLRYRPQDGSYADAGRLPGPIGDAKFIRVGQRWLTTGGEPRGKARSNSTWEGVDQNDPH